MSPVSLGLDIFLIALLLAALKVGFDLNRKLKALREGQAGFVTAVAELDAAAARAEAGLKALRAASEDAHDVLLTRIETARALCVKLETGAADAKRVRAAAPTAPRGESRLDPRFRGEALALNRPPAVRGLDEDLFEATPFPKLKTAGERR